MMLMRVLLFRGTAAHLHQMHEELQVQVELVPALEVRVRSCAAVCVQVVQQSVHSKEQPQKPRRLRPRLPTDHQVGAVNAG